MDEIVNCHSHGEQAVTLVCQHIARANESDASIGFFWSRDDENVFPDAWCRDCNEQLLAADEWNDAMEKAASLKIICSQCYLDLRRMIYGK